MAREDEQAMSAERLAVLKARMEAIPGSVFVTTQKELSQTFFDRNELVNAMEYALSEVERLRAREAALVAQNEQALAIVRAVDRIGRDATGEIVTASPYITDCPLCHQRITGPVDLEPRHPPLPKLGHRSDCPVAQARALLASAPQEQGEA